MEYALLCMCYFSVATYRLWIVLDEFNCLCFYVLGLCCNIHYLVVVDCVVMFYSLTALLCFNLCIVVC